MRERSGRGWGGGAKGMQRTGIEMKATIRGRLKYRE